MSTTLTSFLNTVPQPLTTVLVHLSEPIHALRFLLEAASWTTGSYYDSWLLLAAWWLACLLARGVLLHFLPAAIFCYAHLSRRWNRQTNGVATEHTLQSAINDLTIIDSLLPKISIAIHHPQPYAILYIPYLCLTWCIPLQLLLAISGSIILTIRAPWAHTLRATLLRSAHVRFALYSILNFVSGSPATSPRPRARTASSALTSSPSASLRFLFTVYENQRWWMGLDWTAALIPAERPSWSTLSLQPVSPPSTFSLPDDTTVILPYSSVNPTSGTGGVVVKRTARWRWEEPEWRVVLRREGTEIQPGGVTRVERPLPIIKDEVQGSGLAASGSLSRFAKLRESITSSSSVTSSVSLTELKDKETKEGKVEDSESEHGDEQDAEEDTSEPFTDADGWVYGDNKWEAQSNKGGLGKYTRYRRWTRIAVVEETVEYLDEGHPSLQKISPEELSPLSTTRSSSSDTGTSPTLGNLAEPASAVASGTFTTSDALGEREGEAIKDSPNGSVGRKDGVTVSVAKNSSREEPTPLQQRLKALASRDR